MFGDWVRRTGFWTLDAMRGGEIRKNYLDVKRRMETGSRNEEQLRRLLEHAVNTVPFYSQYAVRDIEQFPIVTKNDFLSDSESMKSTAYRHANKYVASTSGSTGVPFMIEWNMEKRKRQLAEVIYFNEIAGQRLGQLYMYFRGWTEKNRKSKREAWMQNLLPVDVMHIDDKLLEQVTKRLMKKPYVNSCLAYGTTYEHLYRYMKKCGNTADQFHLTTCISSSEALPLNVKCGLKEVAGCKVIDRYSNEENGFLAQSKDCSDVFVVNSASFFVEVLQLNSNEPAQYGELGRIVITDLYNYATPMIRYDTGDLAIKSKEECGWVLELKTIQGRAKDMITDTAGNVISSVSFGNYFWKFNKLKQYQLIQNGRKEYVIRVNGAEGLYTDDMIVQHMRELLGEDAEITVEHVNGIPVLASGKFRKVVNNYNSCNG